MMQCSINVLVRSLDELDQSLRDYLEKSHI
jgi:hypothetical protein